jgi:hypothetical protein
MKEGILTLTTITPFKKPAKHPTNEAAAKAKGIETSYHFIKTAFIQPAIASTEPTERSMPPHIITLASPIARIAPIANCEAIFLMFVELKKCGETKEAIRKSAERVRIGKKTRFRFNARILSRSTPVAIIDRKWGPAKAGPHPS